MGGELLNFLKPYQGQQELEIASDLMRFMMSFEIAILEGVLSGNKITCEAQLLDVARGPFPEDKGPLATPKILCGGGFCTYSWSCVAYS